MANTGEYSYASRLILTTSSGSLQKWQQEEFGWIREESLTEIKAITAMDLPELASNSHMLYRTTDENLIERIVRQLGDLKVRHVSCVFLFALSCYQMCSKCFLDDYRTSPYIFSISFSDLSLERTLFQQQPMAALQAAYGETPMALKRS